MPARLDFSRRVALAFALMCAVILCLGATAGWAQTDPLPSWNDTAPKTAILDFVGRVTKDGGADYVPPAERIATFDNDGTLWAEQPVYFQLAFALDRIAAMAPEHPAWSETEPFKSVLEGNLKAVAASGEHGLLEIVAATHSGITTEKFNSIVDSWLKTAQHPRFKRPYTSLVYQPMLELLAYLRANGFKTFIVSGGGIEFMRTFAERVYGIPPEQVVGSSGVVKFEMGADGKPVLMKEAKVEFVDDGPGKPVGINRFIGRRPIFAFGNSDGDQQMLEWTAAGEGARFMGLVHHTDAEREWAYDRKSHIGKLDKALDEAQAKGWTVVNMKTDWNRIFSFEPTGASPDATPLIAIDVLLQPDARMLKEAAKWNALMREQSPEGFELDELHAPHITLLQRFIAKTDLASVLAAVERAQSTFDIAKMKITATGLYHIPSGKIGLAGIVIEPSRELLALQDAVTEAVNPFARSGGDESAFVPDATGAPFDPLLFKYVDTFVPSQTGQKYNPHVTVGIAPLGWLEDLEKQPFSSFTFGSHGIAVYQLGNFGTASKRLD